MMTHNAFTKNVIDIIRNIPKGKVLTYGRIARLAGNARAARQVSWILHSSSKKYNLPWHRVINSNGKIALRSIEGKIMQSHLLQQEGIKITDDLTIDLNEYLWKITSLDFITRENLSRPEGGE